MGHSAAPSSEEKTIVIDYVRHRVLFFVISTIQPVAKGVRPVLKVWFGRVAAAECRAGSQNEDRRVAQEEALERLE